MGTLILRVNQWWKIVVSVVNIIVGIVYIILGITVSFKQHRDQMTEEDDNQPRKEDPRQNVVPPPKV